MSFAIPSTCILAAICILALSGCAQEPTTSGIHEAAAAGNVVDLAIWLGEGVSINEADEDGATPLVLASRAGHDAAVALLLAEGVSTRDSQALAVAAEAGFPKVVTLLIAAGMDVNKSTNAYNGLTALMMAAREGHLDVMVTFVEAGATVNRQTPSGISALSSAAAGATRTQSSFCLALERRS